MAIALPPDAAAPRPPVADLSVREVAARSPMSGSAPGGLEGGLPVRSRLVAPSLLAPGEIILFELKPSLWYVVFTSLPLAAVGVLVLLIALGVSELSPSARQLGIVLGAWIVGLRVALAILQWLGRTYVLTDRRVLAQFGVINVEVQVMGLEEIASSFVAQAAAQRVLGIGTLFFRSDQARGFSMSWQHINRPKEVHAHVLAQIERWRRSQQGPPRIV